MLVQHYAGYWPVWLSPRQVCIMPVSERFTPYAKRVLERCRSAGLYADLDATDETLGRRLRHASQVQYNRLVVVGEDEHRNQTVSVRNRDIDTGPVTMPLDEMVNELKQAVVNRR